MQEDKKRGISVHADSFSVLSRLSAVRSRLESNDLFAQAQAHRMIVLLIEEIESGIPSEL